VDAYFIGVFDTVASLGSKGIVRLLIAASLVGGALLLCYLAALAVEALFGWGVWLTAATLSGLGLARFLLSTVRSTLKYIRHYPERGNLRWHFAKWNMKNYNRGLSARVRYARHALSIDETRADFPRVQWGFKNIKPTREEGEPEYLQQIWFAGNHSDIGGSYPEEESRLSDIALEWMVEQTAGLPHPLILDSTKLHLFPDPFGLQHCEVESLRNCYPSWVPTGLRFTWAEKPRTEVLEAPVHPSVIERFALPRVSKCGQATAYRPEVFRADPRFARYYTGA
jgi:hypothetical protein